MQIGHVSEVWRYPVKSMGGGRVQRAAFNELGMIGDRAWAVREDGDTRSARQIPALLQCAARFTSEPSADAESAAISIELPDGGEIDQDAADRLGAALGREVALVPLRPASDSAYFARPSTGGEVDQAAQLAMLRQVFGLEDDDPLPDLSGLPASLGQFSTPPGTFVDCYPLHVMTTASLRQLAEFGGGEEVDVRRFRPNLVIDTGDAEGLVETGWPGRELRIGGIVAQVKTTTVRCSVPAHAQRGMERSRAVGRALIERASQHLGAYAEITVAGEVAEGDPVELL